MAATRREAAAFGHYRLAVSTTAVSSNAKEPMPTAIRINSKSGVTLGVIQARHLASVCSHSPMVGAHCARLAG